MRTLLVIFAMFVAQGCVTTGINQDGEKVYNVDMAPAVRVLFSPVIGAIGVANLALMWEAISECGEQRVNEDGETELFCPGNPMSPEGYQDPDPNNRKKGKNKRRMP